MPHCVALTSRSRLLMTMGSVADESDVPGVDWLTTAPNCSAVGLGTRVAVAVGVMVGVGVIVADGRAVWVSEMPAKRVINRSGVGEKVGLRILVGDGVTVEIGCAVEVACIDEQPASRANAGITTQLRRDMSLFQFMASPIP